MIPNTTERVQRSTAPAVDAMIRRRTDQRIAWYVGAGREAISRRLAELDQEWDIERVLETNAAAISLAGLALGAASDRRWFFLPAVVAGFLLQHAIQGWCPPVPLLRRLGFRTPREIEYERTALKALRGDFQAVEPATGESLQRKLDAALEAARA